MKVKIRKTELADARDLHRNLNNEDVIKELSGYAFPCPLSRVQKDIRKGLRDWEERRAYAFTIVADNQIAGQIFLENPSKDFGRYEVGFYIGRQYWGLGIAARAIKQAVSFGFDKLKLYKIWADNDSDNPGSGKALQKAGFTLEGTLKKHSKKKGKFIDLLIWGKTR